MDRRSFLLGTVAALAAMPAAADPVARIRLADLRGTIPGAEPLLRPGAVDDQSLTIQAAIDRAAGEGRPLFLPAGRYEVSNLVLPPRLKIIGIAGETRLVYSGGGHLLFAAAADGIGIDGVVLDGANRALADGTPGLLHLADCADVTIERCDVVGSARHAIALEAVSGRVTANRLTGSRESGIWSVAGRGLSITDNLVSDCGHGGILVHRWQKGEDDTIVARNRIRRIDSRPDGAAGFGDAIAVVRADGVVVSDNHVADCSGTAVRARSAGNVRIAGNTCLRLGATAILAEHGLDGAVIADNIIDGATLGIVAAAGEQQDRLAVIGGNVVRRIGTGTRAGDFATGVGIRVEAETSVTGNVVESADTVGILVGWDRRLRNVALTGNVIRDCPVGMAVSVADGAGNVYLGGNLLGGTPDGAVRGLRDGAYVTGDLLGLAVQAFPHLSIGVNRTG